MRDCLNLAEERRPGRRVLLGVGPVQELEGARMRRAGHRMRGIQVHPKLERGVEDDARGVHDQEVVLIALLDPPGHRGARAPPR